MKRPAPRAALAFAALLTLSGCMGTPLHREDKEPSVRVVPFALPPQPDAPAVDPEAAPFAPEPAKTAVAQTRIAETAPEPAKVAPEAVKASESKEAAALAAAMQQIARSKTDYKISSADLVAVTVYQDPDMSRKVRVNSNGTAALPLIGAVKIGGLSLLDAQAVIEAKLSKFLVNPQVSLFIEEYGNKLVFVMGEVQKPGSYPIPTEKSLTVLEAVSTAGGFTPIAAQDRTKVLRNVNGNSVTFTIEVKAITQGGQKDKDLVLEPNDVIYVPQSFF
jgi:protein involved in polysaccharide export with SLBB domain